MNYIKEAERGSMCEGKNGLKEGAHFLPASDIDLWSHLMLLIVPEFGGIVISDSCSHVAGLSP